MPDRTAAPAAGPAPGAVDGWAAGAANALGAVLGAGTLLLPAALAPASASRTGIAVAAVLAGWCLLVAAAGGTEHSGPVAFVRGRLGPGPARAVTALYFGGFATGQAAVALGTAQFAAGALASAGVRGAVTAAGGDSGWRSYAVAAAVLGTAAVYAWCVPRPPSPTGQRLRLAAVLALALAWRALGGPLPGAGTDGRAALLVAVPLLFGWVGLEGAVPALARRRALGGTLLGIALAAALYAVLLAPQSSAPTAHPVAAAALGLGSAAVCWTYVRTNLRATAARWTELTGRTRRGGLLAAALIALGALTLGRAAHGGVSVLLLGPGAATAALYTLIAVAALRRPRPQENTDHDHHDGPDRNHDHDGHDRDRSDRALVLEGAARAAR
ncbi:hypothetical protein OV450_3773 [Actinobacteria bacterium OV450]|nr:hypothetical protein OV450_3773 [Actinobacteria bacterium OV450]